MTIYERRFVDNFLIHLDPVEAILSIGFTGKWPKQAANMMRRRPHISSAIRAGILQMQEKAALDRDWVVERLKLIADANIQDVVTFDKAGNAVVDPMLIPRNKAYAIDSYEIVHEPPGKAQRRPGKKAGSEGGGSARSGVNENTGTLRAVKKLKIKMKDSLGALNKLGIVVGLFADEGPPVGVVRFILEGAPPVGGLIEQVEQAGVGALDATPVAGKNPV